MLQIIEARSQSIGRLAVRRALPTRERRMLGAWCFADHMGPIDVPDLSAISVAPHPHMGLQTVTWLLDGEFLHRDSLGTEQLIRPGQVNLMTAGRGVSHSEESTSSQSGRLHGVQLWIAQPSRTRDGDPGFEHHAALPCLTIDGCEARVLIGEFAGSQSPASAATPLTGVDLVVHATTTLELRTDFDYGILVLEGNVRVQGVEIRAGHLAVLPPKSAECELDTDRPAHVMLLGGTPFDEQITMWWNYVGRTRAEIVEANQSWNSDDGRFGRVDSPLPRLPGPTPPWSTP